MTDSKRNTRFQAEIASALVLIEELSAKSSDSGLSEETCWELFGGPCPEALRKKMKSLQEDVPLEEEDNYYSVSELPVTTSKEKFAKKYEQIKEDIKVQDAQGEAGSLEKYSESSFKENKPSGESKIFQENKLSKENDLSKESNLFKESKVSKEGMISPEKSQGNAKKDGFFKASSLENEAQERSSKEHKPSYESKTSKERKLSKESQLSNKNRLCNEMNLSTEKSRDNIKENGDLKASSLENKGQEKSSKEKKPSYESKTSKESKLSNNFFTQAVSKESRISKDVKKSDVITQSEQNESKEKYKEADEAATASSQTEQIKKNTEKPDIKRNGDKDENARMEPAILSQQSLEMVSAKDLGEPIENPPNTVVKEKPNSSGEKKIKPNKFSNIIKPNDHETSVIQNGNAFSEDVKYNADTHENKKHKPTSESVTIGTSTVLQETHMENIKISKNEGMKKSPMQISTELEENRMSISKTKHTSTTETNNISTTVSSIARNKKIFTNNKTERRHSIISDTYISTSETSLLSDGNKRQFNDFEFSDSKKCICICCVDRHIRQSHKKVFGSSSGNKEPITCQCCAQSDNKYQIKIYSNDIPSGEEKNCKKTVQITSFNDNKTLCNKRLQTSTPIICNNSRSKFPCPYMHNIDPLYLNSGLLRPVYSKNTAKYTPETRYKATKKDCRCSGDCRQKSVKIPPSSDNSNSDFEYSNKSSCDCDVANNEMHCTLADSLKDSLLKRTVKDTVKKFEEKNKYSLFIYGETDDRNYQQRKCNPINPKYKEGKLSLTISKHEICRCCNGLKQMIKKRPNVPIPKHCNCCNYTKHY